MCPEIMRDRGSAGRCVAHQNDRGQVARGAVPKRQAADPLAAERANQHRIRNTELGEDTAEALCGLEYTCIVRDHSAFDIPVLAVVEMHRDTKIIADSHVDVQRGWVRLERATAYVQSRRCETDKYE